MLFSNSINLIHLCEHEDTIFNTNKNINWTSYSETNTSNNTVIEHQIGMDSDTNNVYWRKGFQSKYESLTYAYQIESSIIQALICEFTSSDNTKNSPIGKMACLCVLEVNRITAFSTNGEIYNISLPFPVKRIWSSPFGLLLQRLPSEHELSSLGNQIISGINLPVLFSLTHPLNEPCHVLYKYSVKEDAIVNSLCDPHLEVIHVNRDPSYLIMYDSRHNQHSVWKILAATTRDIPTTTNITQIDDFIGTMPKSFQMSSSAPPRTKHFEVTPFNSPLKLYTPSPIIRNRHCNIDSTHTPIPLATSVHKSRRNQDSFVLGEDRNLRISTRRNVNNSNISIGSCMQQKSSIEFGSGRITRKQSSNIKLRNNNLITQTCNSRLGAGSASRKKAKSLSPNTSIQKSTSVLSHNNVINCVSDYNYPFDELSEPVYPEICLLNLFTENTYTQMQMGRSHKAAAAFYCKNLINEEYIVFVMSDLSEIHLRQINTTNGHSNSVEFGVLQILFAKYAVPLAKINLIVCMHTTDALLTLYSGVIRISNIVHDVPYPPVSFYDYSNDQISILFDNNTTHRFQVKSFPENTTINVALETFLHMLPANTTHCIYIDVYTNLIQTCTKTQLDIFLNFMRSILQIKIPSKNNSSISHNSDDKNWKYLQSHIHLYARNNDIYNCLKTGLISNTAVMGELIAPNITTRLSKEHIITTIYALHLTLEEILLDNNLFHDVISIIQLLVDLSKHYSLPLTYLEYYFTLAPSLYTSTNMKESVSRPHTKSAILSCDINQLPRIPPSISQFLRDWLMGKYPLPYKCIISVHRRCCLLIYLYTLLLFPKCKKDSKDLEKILSPLHKASTIDSTTQQTLINLLCRDNIPNRIPLFMIEMNITKQYLLSYPVAYITPVLNAIDVCKQNPPSDFSTMAYFLIDRPDLAFQSAEDKSDMNKIFTNVQFKNSQLSKARLVPRCEDEKFREAFLLVDSSVPITIDLIQRPEVTDEEFMEKQTTWLSKHLNRTLALPVGRGMITYGTYNSFPTEKILFTEFNFTGNVPGSSLTINTPNMDKQSQLLVWPQFHNGVACGLTLNPKIDFVDSSWVQFNNPGDEKSNEYAGYLMAMGLQGHITNLSKFVIHDLLSKGHDLIPVGLLLGIAAAKVGSMDQDITRMLSIHVHSLQPESSMELEISPTVQTAAILSVGLLYQGSGNRYIVDVLLNELERISGSDMETIYDRKCRCLSAGFALGLTLLGFGLHKSHLPMRQISERLCRNISADEPSSFPQDKINKSQLILDLGIDIMSFGPGSIMALTFIYMKSDIISISNYMKPSDSLYKLYECQPFILFQQTLSYCLIQWNSILATEDWLLNLFPSKLIDSFKNNWKDLPDGIEDFALSTAYYTMLASCVLAIGLKYVSSHNEDALKFLLEYLQIFLKEKKNLPPLTYNLCINCTLLASSLVMCGTGNSTLLHILTQFRNVPLDDNEDTVYGNQLAIHMSLGFLFLGNCQYSISPKQESIAYLIIALYPIFPLKSNDNIYHLQAFRHIYALGIEQRLLIAKTIHTETNTNTNQSCDADVNIIYELDNVECTQEVKLPYLVPQSINIKSIHLKSKKYWPINIEGNKEYFDTFFKNGGTLYLLSKNIHQPLKFLSVSEWTKYDIDNSNFIGNISFIKSMSYKPSMVSLVYINNNNNNNNWCDNSSNSSGVFEFDNFDKNLITYSLLTNQNYLFGLLLQLKLNAEDIINNHDFSLIFLLQFVFLYYFYHAKLIEKPYTLVQEYIMLIDMRLYLAIKEQLCKNRGEVTINQLMKLFEEKKFFRINKDNWKIVAKRLCYGRHDRQKQ